MYIGSLPLIYLAIEELRPRRNVLKQPTKRITALISDIFCERCYLRLALAERRRTRDGKTYHQDCYTKLKIPKTVSQIENQLAETAGDHRQ